jgi:hypothetical protein
VFDTFPQWTKQLVLYASEVDPDGRVPTRPADSSVEILVLNNVAFVQNHMNHSLRTILRPTKGLDVQTPRGYVWRSARDPSPRGRLTGQEHSAYFAVVPRRSRQPVQEGATLTNTPAAS